MRVISRFPLTIVSGTTTAAFELNGSMILAVSCPSGISSTAFSFQTSMDGGATYQAFYKDGADKSYTCAASKNVSVADDHIIASHAKLVMGSSETDKTFIVTAMRMD